MGSPVAVHCIRFDFEVSLKGQSQGHSNFEGCISHKGADTFLLKTNRSHVWDSKWVIRFDLERT